MTRRFHVQVVVRRGVATSHKQSVDSCVFLHKACVPPFGPSAARCCSHEKDPPSRHRDARNSKPFTCPRPPQANDTCMLLRMAVDSTLVRFVQWLSNFALDYAQFLVQTKDASTLHAGAGLAERAASTSSAVSVPLTPSKL